MIHDKKKGIIINSSLSLSKENLSFQEYRDKLIYLLGLILNSIFLNEPAKRIIVPHINRISIACPYCMDSMKKSWAKRGNLILKGKYENYYKCFNCGIFKRIDNFFKDFNINIKLDVIEYISQHTSNFNIFAGKKYDISLLMDEDSINKYALDREEIKTKLGLIEVEEDFQIHEWLKNRLQVQNEKFLYNSAKDYLVILNLVNGKILGLQKRNFRKNSIKYLTYKLSKLYKGFRPGIEVPEEIDSLSELFGIMQLNFNIPITLFEGPFDSFLFKNSIASSGSNKTFPLDLPLRYFYDKDPTGLKESIKKINNKEKVFLWGKFFRDFEIPYKKKWDLSDLLIYFNNKKINPPNFDLYFSDDPLDIINL